MGAEVKARIAVDAQDALKRIEDINKAAGYTATSMSALAKGIGTANRALDELKRQGKIEDELFKTVNEQIDPIAFKTLKEQLEKQAVALELVTDKSDIAAKKAALYKNSLLSLTKAGALNKEQMDDLARLYNQYNNEAQAIVKRNKELAKAQRESAEETARIEKMTKDVMAQLDASRLQSFADSIDRINLSLSEMAEQEQRVQQINARNADIGFMMVTGDKKGVADYTLKEYEATLKQTIIDTGINSEATKKATEAYMKQKAAVDQLAKAQGSHELKLLSVAKNILKFQLLMGPITAAVRGFKNTISESMNVAAEAEQRFSKLATVFDGFADSAKRAATELASTIGVANSTAASALSTIGDLLQAQGMGTSESLATASRWTKQFADIIAFKDINMTLEEFAQNFMSGTAGNLRNFRTFGSIVKESAVQAELMRKGLDKLTGSELELAKMTTRAELALKQQSNAMGATQREWDTMLSVNRRLNEAWKEYKENLGETLNSLVKPLKSEWTSMLEQINKSNKAQKEFLAGNRNIKVYDVYNSGEDSYTFQKTLRGAMNEYRNNLSFAANALIDGVEMASDVEVLSTAINTLDSILIKFNATVDTARHVLGEELTPEMYKELKDREAARNLKNKRLEDIENRRSAISSTAGRYDSFTESLNGITGIEIVVPDWSAQGERFAYDEGGDKVFASNVASSMMKAVSDSLESIKTSDLSKTWGDVISGALDELDEQDLKEARIKSVRSLFESAWNQFLPDGFSEDEKRKLEEIQTTYRKYVKELDEYSKAVERQKALLSAYKTEASAVSSYNRLRYESGLEGPDSYKTLQTSIEWDIPLLVESFAKSLRDAGVELKTVNERSEAYRRTLVNEANLKYSIALRNAQNEAVAGYRSQAEGYRSERLALGLSDADVTRGKLIAEQEEAIADGNNELVTAISAVIIQFDLLQKAVEEQKKLEAQKTIAEQYNPFSSTIEAWNRGRAAFEGEKFEAFGQPWEITGFGAGVIGILGDILKETEVFSDLTGILSDTIVPILDAVLRPLLPALEMIRSVFDALPWDMILFMIKVISSTIVLILTPIKIIMAVIKNIYTAVHNILQRILHPITGGDQWGYESLSAIMDESQATLEKIWATELDIRRNTEKGDDYAKQLALLKDLYVGGALNLSEYSGAVAKVTGTPMGRIESYAGTSYAQGSGGVTYFSGDIVINGYNRDPEELALEIDRILSRRALAGGRTFA